MKKIILAFVLAFTLTGGFAKKIKFAVDMTNEVISPNGVHLMGTFQSALGLPLGDWQPNTLPLIQEGTSMIYSAIVNIPAFSYYEFRFVNGDLSYEQEFVPDESRVEPFVIGNDNRWFYLDSLQNDTTDWGAIIFAKNAPAGKTLVRFMVDMANEASVSSNGVHVGGTFQSSTWNAKNNILYNLNSVHQVITYVTNANYEFRYYNGNTSGNIETVTGTCVNGSGNRTYNVTKDSILPTVCYKACVNCSLAGISELQTISGVKMYPNPVTDLSVIEFKNKDVNYSISLADVSGRILKTYFSNNGEEITIRKNEISSGMYFVNITDSKNAKSSSKLIIE